MAVKLQSRSDEVCVYSTVSTSYLVHIQVASYARLIFNRHLQAGLCPEPRCRRRRCTQHPTCTRLPLAVELMSNRCLLDMSGGSMCWWQRNKRLTREDVSRGAFQSNLPRGAFCTSLGRIKCLLNMHTIKLISECERTYVKKKLFLKNVILREWKTSGSTSDNHVLTDYTPDKMKTSQCTKPKGKLK